MDSNPLIKLAKDRFELSDDEQSFLETVLTYQEIPARTTGTDEAGSPKKPTKSELQPKLSAQLLVWLCTDADAVAQIPRWGIRVFDAQIEGSLNLQSANITFPLIFRQCCFTEAIRLECASLPLLDLSGSHLLGSQIIDLTADATTAALAATYLQVEHHVLFNDNFEAEGEVRLLGANIGGQLTCSGGKFRNKNGMALNAQGAEIGKDVFLRNDFEAEGEVWLLGANIGGQFDGSEGKFRNENGTALNAEGAEIGQNFILGDGFVADGEVWLPGTKIGGQLICSGGKFRNANGTALNAEGAEIGKDVFFRNNFGAEGEVRLTGANIGGQFDGSEGKFRNENGTALNAEGAEIGQNFILGDGFVADGKVRLPGTKIGGQLICSGGKFRNENGTALNAEGAEIGQNFILGDSFAADGEVWLPGAKIRGQFNCSKGKFRNENYTALNAEGVEIGKDILLTDGFKADGEVRLTGAKIRGQFNCSKGKFHNKNGTALNAEGVEIGKDVLLTDGFKADGEVDFSFATARVLNDKKEDWPATLHLNGFTYEKLDPAALVDVKERLQWLRLPPNKPFSPQPYEQLATVFKASGHDEAATEVLIGQQNDRIQHSNMHPIKKGLNRVLGIFIAHGYRSYRALFWAAGLIVVGAGLFQGGYSHPSQLITPSDIGSAPTESDNSQESDTVSADYPTFNALMYSTDVFLPIIDLKQQSYWMPNANRGSDVSLLRLKSKEGALLRWYFWAHIILGWVLTSLWVAGFTGLVRKLD